MTYKITVRNNIPIVGNLKEVRYIVAHETANPTSIFANEIAYMERTWQKAFVTHFVGDGGKIVQIAKPGYVSWGAGKYANPYSYAQVELSRDRHDPVKFKQNYQAYIWLLRKLAKDSGLPLRLDEGLGIVSHRWVSQNLGGTDHTDPYGFLQEMGISKEQFKKDLTAPTNFKGWVKENNHWYYYKNNQKVTHWQLIDNTWYFFLPDGKMKTGWQLVGGTWYYLESNGKMKTGWLTLKDKTYYLKENGAMVRGGLISVNKKIYYFKNSGELAKPGFHSDRWFVTKSTGELHYGWYQLNNIWYYLDSDGYMKTGWLKLKDIWYYLEPISGRCLISEKRWINGKEYQFDGSGKCLNP